MLVDMISENSSLIGAQIGHKKQGMAKNFKLKGYCLKKKNLRDTGAHASTCLNYLTGDRMVGERIRSTLIIKK